MAKCSFCNSCLRVIFVDNERYFVCAFCKTIYTSNNVKLTTIIDPIIIGKVAEQKGWTIE